MKSDFQKVLEAEVASQKVVVAEREEEVARMHRVGMSPWVILPANQELEIERRVLTTTQRILEAYKKHGGESK